MTSKEQLTNGLMAVAGFLTSLKGVIPIVAVALAEAPLAIDGATESLEHVATGIQTSDVTLMVSGAVGFAIGLARYFGRLNRKQEIVDAVKEAMK